MSTLEKKRPASVDSSSPDEEDQELVALGYKPSFKREFTNLSTVRYSIFIKSMSYSYRPPNICAIDQLRFQYNGMTSFPTTMTKRIILIVLNSVGSVLQYFNDIQHSFDARRTLFGMLIFSCSNSYEACNFFLTGRMVLDSRSVHVLHAWI